MKAMIIEDERMAREQLANVLRSNFCDIEIVKTTDSVNSSVEYLRNSAQPDVIFMDIELLDGNAFEIFRLVNVKSNVIMTTAYDSWAVKAFEEGSVDYLLKPISLDRLKRAVGRCREKSGWRKLITIRYSNRIVPISTEKTAYIFSDNKANYLMTFNREKYLVENTMDQLESELDPGCFTRISRGCIINRQALLSVEKDRSGHFTVKLNPEPDEAFSVARPRISAFMKWMNNNN